MEKLPKMSYKLIEKLDEETPKPKPHPDKDREELLYKAGKRAIVDYLLSLAENQKEQDMDGDINV